MSYVRRPPSGEGGSHDSMRSSWAGESTPLELIRCRRRTSGLPRVVGDRGIGPLVVRGAAGLVLELLDGEVDFVAARVIGPDGSVLFRDGALALDGTARFASSLGLAPKLVHAFDTARCTPGRSPSNRDMLLASLRRGPMPSRRDLLRRARMALLAFGGRAVASTRSRGRSRRRRSIAHGAPSVEGDARTVSGRRDARPDTRGERERYGVAHRRAGSAAQVAFQVRRRAPRSSCERRYRPRGSALIEICSARACSSTCGLRAMVTHRIDAGSLSYVPTQLVHRWPARRSVRSSLHAPSVCGWMSGSQRADQPRHSGRPSVSDPRALRRKRPRASHLGRGGRDSGARDGLAPRCTAE